VLAHHNHLEKKTINCVSKLLMNTIFSFAIQIQFTEAKNTTLGHTYVNTK